MSGDLLERDWKTLRALHPVALNRFCKRVLAEVTSIASDESRSNHERYLAIYKLIEERDRQIEDAFNDMRRSRAVIRLCHMSQLGLVSEKEFARFSDGMHSVVETFVGERRIPLAGTLGDNSRWNVADERANLRVTKRQKCLRFRVTGSTRSVGAAAAA